MGSDSVRIGFGLGPEIITSVVGLQARIDARLGSEWVRLGLCIECVDCVWNAVGLGADLFGFARGVCSDWVRIGPGLTFRNLFGLSSDWLWARFRLVWDCIRSGSGIDVGSVLI